MERDRSQSENEPASAAGVRILSEMPSFEEHMRQKRTKGERAQRILELTKVVESRKDEAAFEGMVQGMNGEGAYKYLTLLNGVLRGASRSERGAQTGVRVGEHMAPSRDVQNAMLNETVVAMRGISDNHYRATLAYYTVNNMHLFGDGNGRTSRAVYEIFDNPDFDLGGDAFMHKTDSSGESGNHGAFEAEHGIRPASEAYWIAGKLTAQAYWIAGKLTAQALAKNGTIDERAAGKFANIAIAFGDDPDIYLTEDAEQGLSPQEKRSVNAAFHDGDIALVSLARVLMLKGTSKSVMDESERTTPDGRKFLSVEVEKMDLDDSSKPNEVAARTFAGWTADDYRMFLRSFKSVQLANQRMMIDIFKNPQNHKVNENLTTADWLSRTKQN